MLIGVDVGTGSARAGVFDRAGRLLGLGKHPVTIWTDPGEIVEQSGAQIWQAVCHAVRGAMAEAGVAAEAITGIGFVATCSLMVVDAAGQRMAIETLVGSGGAAQSSLACQMLADSTGLPVALPEAPEPVLLGAITSGAHADAGSAMAAMSGPARLFQPVKGALAALHHRRFAAFTALQ